MLSYKYTARDPATGEYVKANVQAESETAAARLIRKEGLVAIDISLDEKGTSGLSGRFMPPPVGTPPAGALTRTNR